MPRADARVALWDACCSGSVSVFVDVSVDPVLSEAGLTGTYSPQETATRRGPGYPDEIERRVTGTTCRNGRGLLKQSRDDPARVA
jgi:hypothetical protein